MFPSTYFFVHFGISQTKIKIKRWLEMPRCASILKYMHKNLFHSTEADTLFRYAHRLWRKHSSMRNKKTQVTFPQKFLITGLTSGPITSQHLKYRFGGSETQNLWSEWFGLIEMKRFNMRTQENMTAFASSETRLVYNEGIKRHNSNYWYCVPVSQEVMIWFSWTPNGNCFIVLNVQVWV